MKILIAEDDFTSRRIMKHMLSGYGDCDIAVNGLEAVEMFKAALAENSRYDLICMDIMMPEMDGHEALTKIRAHEAQIECDGEAGVKVIMTTALEDFDNVSAAFSEQCEGYLVKPVELKTLEELLRKLELIA